MKAYLSLVLLACMLIISGCSKDQEEVGVDLMHRGVDVVNQAIVHDVFSPPVASRVYAYPFVAAYEVLAYNDSSYHSIQGKLNGDFKLSVPNSVDGVNYELSSLLAYLYTARELVFTKSFIDNYLGELELLFPNNFESSSVFGLSVSKAVLEWARKDNYAETRSFEKYDVTNAKVEEGQWIPTPPNYMEPIEPNWGKIRTFLLDSATQFVPDSPPAFDLSRTSVFYKDLVELYDSTKNLNEEQIVIAEFWDCNPFVMTSNGHNMSSYKKITPGGHWIGIAGIAAQTSQASFIETCHIYMKTSIVLADAFISCWSEKYRSNLIRPETVINFNLDAEWRPILQTPPFPEYTSGHSVASGAAAMVLTDLVGENFFFSDTTEVKYGLPVRNFSSFREASKEAAISRFYGGIHYKPAIVNGLVQGEAIGEFYNNNLDFR